MTHGKEDLALVTKSCTHKMMKIKIWREETETYESTEIGDIKKFTSIW